MEEVFPNYVLSDWPIRSLRVLDDSAEVAASAILHEDVENPILAVDMTVVVTNYVLMGELLEGVSVGGGGCQSR